MANGGIEYIIFVPEGYRTGGPECLHQLASSLSRQGFDATILPARNSDFQSLKQIQDNGNLVNDSILNFKPSRELVKDYERSYPGLKKCSRLKLRSTTVFILPEIWANWAILFHSWICVIWWLSVDNAFHSMPNINWLKRPKIFHISQSKYSEQFLHLTGLEVFGRLHDPVQLPPKDTKQKDILSIERRIISISGSHKNIFDLKHMSTKIKGALGIQTHILQNLTQEEFFTQLESSLIYIDLGNFPGRDKPPREAAVRNAVPLLSSTGAAFWGDFFLPSYLLIDPFKDNLISHLNYILKNPYKVARDIKVIKELLLKENNKFDKDVLTLFSRFHVSA